MAKELPKHYNPKEAEPKWAEWWEQEKIYAFDPKSKAPIYSIDTPPPTVSGKMHIGHAFSYSQMDFIARYKRMRGFNLFYPFGTDDNGLPTERLVEKMKNVRSVDMSRKDFVKLCLDTLEKELRPKYIQDWKNIGTSADFDVYYTTIDDHCRKISQRSFIELYKMDREYRKRAPFMWCPECRTAISQVELKDEERESNFVYIKFDTSIGKPITFATTRPELLPACVAVHVNPDDKRYKEFIGAKAKIPFSDREVEIYANKEADPEFGTGVVYHCTFGDMDDIAWIKEMDIKPIEVMNTDGTLNEKAGQFKGMSMKEARKAVVEALQAEGRVTKIEPIKHVVNTHEKCGTDIEIRMTEQWFIRYLDLKDDFIAAGNQINWRPAFMKSRFDNWIEGLKWDWCISRQRLFGVPIPVWYCKKCNEVMLPDVKDLPVDPLKDTPGKACKCGCKEFVGEKDVLDTWATSSLTPRLAAELFPDLVDKIYPMNLRPQAHDIITFWLFNTVVKSMLHDRSTPWKDIMISGWALDSHGKKMSKSKGNVVEPQAMIEKYSADALRFWAAGSSLGEDLPFQEKDLATGQKFATKLVNASKFVIMQLKGYKPGKTPVKLRAVDKWILSRLNTVIQFSTENFDKYEYSKAKLECEKFFWHEFCDYYLEIVKDRLYAPEKYAKGEKEAAQYTLYTVASNVLKLFAPIMPYVTEEIYQMYFKKFEKAKSIHIAKWPEAGKTDEKAENIGETLKQLVSAVRQYKQEKGMSLGKEVKTICIDTKDAELKKVIPSFKLDLQGASRAGKLELKKSKGDLVKCELPVEMYVEL